MTIVPLFGHRDIRAAFARALERGALPAALLLHGPRGVGKQRLALWAAQLLLCDRVGSEPCGECQDCRFAAELRHPDLHWYFPRPRPTDTEPDLDAIEADYAEAVAERVERHGLYDPPSGSDGIYVATVRAIVRQAGRTPAIARRKVFVIGDAERMVPQEGAEFAANAFLKLLEEPPANTFLILTSSEPGALLPTIRSRVVRQRVGPLKDEEVRDFLAHGAVAARLGGEGDLPAGDPDRVRFSAGAPGRLLSGASWAQSVASARALLGAVTSEPAARYEAAWAQASAKARGVFAESLDALTVALHERARDLVRQGSERPALATTRAIALVEEAKERVASNVSPQLITVNLLRELHEVLS